MTDISTDLIRSEFFKALSHPTRIRILRLLRSGEKSVMELQENLGIESSGVSQQLALLRTNNLVVARKDGTRVYYAVKDSNIFRLLDTSKQILDNQHDKNRAMLDELEREENLFTQMQEANENSPNTSQ